jgi:hypothetical protein
MAGLVPAIHAGSPDPDFRGAADKAIKARFLLRDTVRFVGDLGIFQLSLAISAPLWK